MGNDVEIEKASRRSLRYRHAYEIFFNSQNYSPEIMTALANLFYNHDEVTLTVLDPDFGEDELEDILENYIFSGSVSRIIYFKAGNDRFDMLKALNSSDIFSRDAFDHSFDVTVPIFRGLYRTTQNGLTVYRPLPRDPSKSEQEES